MKIFYTILLYVTSWIMRVSVRKRWWKVSYKVGEFRKHMLSPKLRSLIKKSNERKRHSTRQLSLSRNIG